MRTAIALLVSLISMQAQIPQPTDFDGWKSRGFGLLVAGQFQEAAGAFLLYALSPTPHARSRVRW